MDIGSKIRSIRKDKGLSQIDVAKRAEIAVNSLRLYESGSRQPNIEQLQSIATALEVKLLDLIGPTEASLPWDVVLDQKLSAVGYSVGFDDKDAYLWINYPDGTLEVTQDELIELNASTDSFVRFKLEELKQKKPGAFRAKK